MRQAQILSVHTDNYAHVHIQRQPRKSLGTAEQEHHVATALQECLEYSIEPLMLFADTQLRLAPQRIELLSSYVTQRHHAQNGTTGRHDSFCGDASGHTV